MRKLSVILFLIFCIVQVVLAQHYPLTESERQKQVNYIRQDTLPVTVLALPPQINSRYSEYGGIRYADSTFFFSAMRYQAFSDQENFFENRWSSVIFRSQLTKDGYTTPEALPEIINHRKYFNANFTFNANHTWLIYARCLRNKDETLQCELWETRKEAEKWEKPHKVEGIGNSKNYSTTQPYRVDYPDYDVLYFASDRPNGYGNMDIWYAIYKDGKFQNPINTGSKINSEGNEITPFYDKEEEQLYFSSDEWIGIGGYDIFVAQGALSSFSSPTNMGVPFNSTENDIYFNITPERGSGYFSSNRPTSLSAPEDTCCNDIFYYEWKFPTDTPALADDSTLPAVDSLLPLTLFFPNDEPDPKSKLPTTDKEYSAIYRQYLSMKEDYVAHEPAMSAFFADSVQKNYEQLLQLCHQIKQLLTAGKKVQLEISGYASALFDSQYNFNLSARRMASVTNFLLQYDQQVLLPFYKDKDDRFTIVETAYGSNNDRQYDDTNTGVYSLQSALARKIVIHKIIIVE